MPTLPAGAGEVHGLYVDPDRIGTGLGRRLFAHAVSDLVERHDPIVVWHFAGNGRAARFYDAAGFPSTAPAGPAGSASPRCAGAGRRPG